MPGPKKAQRTKGNLKPSSSSQAVQLLTQSGHAAKGFIGFSNQPAYVPASELFDDGDETLDSDFRLVLRKFSKKDTTTKIKALQEFSALCVTKSEDCIKAVLPFWPRIYNKVAIDVDHKVRELSQKALLAIAERAGKNLSSHLQSIMGPWMVSMYDTYPTVSSAATTAFNTIFPVAKQTAAIRFCKKESVEYFLTNITKQTPQTLSDPQTTSDEDMVGKYQRVVTSSLQALRKLASELIQKDADYIAECLKTLFNSAAFWKHAKSSVPIINSGLLSIISCVCQLCPSVSGPYLNKISPLVFSFIDSKDPVLVSPSWEALLSLINVHDECWQHVNWQKAVWPKLKSVLESGCSGYAEIIAPCLLPLFSKLPSQANFVYMFDAMRQGLSQESVVNSGPTMATLIKAFVECAHYCVKTVAQKEDTSSQSVIRGLVHDQVLVVVAASLTDTKSSLSKSPLYQSLHPLLSFLQNQPGDIEKEFWEELSTFVHQNLLSVMISKNDETNTGKFCFDHSVNLLLERIPELVRSIVYTKSTNSGAVKKERVKFACDDDSDKSTTLTIKHTTTSEKRAVSKNLENFISNLMVMSFYLGTELELFEYFTLFKNLSAIHISADTIKRLNNSDVDPVKLELYAELNVDSQNRSRTQMDEEKLEAILKILPSELSNEFCQFLYNYLLKFVVIEGFKDNGPNLAFTDDLLSSSFVFLQYLDDTEVSQYISTAFKVLSTSSQSPCTMCQLIEHLIDNAGNIPACFRALNTDEIQARIEQITSRVANVDQMEMGEEENGSLMWKVLESFVSSLDDGPYISNRILDSVINGCITNLDHWQQSEADVPSPVINHLFAVIQLLFDKQKVLGHSNFFALLSSLIYFVLESSHLDEKMMEKAENMMRMGFQLAACELPHDQNYSCLYRICDAIKLWVSSHLNTHAKLDMVMKIVSLLMSVISSGEVIEAETYREQDLDDERDHGKLEPMHRIICRQMIAKLVYSDCVHIEELSDLIDELYVKETIFHLPVKKDVKTGIESMSLESYTLLLLYNTKVITTIHGIHLQLDDCDNNTVTVHSLSDTEFLCHSQAIEFLYFFSGEIKDNSLVKKEVMNVVTELRREITNRIAGMTSQQIMKLVNVVLKCHSDVPSTHEMTVYRVMKFFHGLLFSETDLHSKRAVSNGLQHLQTAFIYRCIKHVDEADCIVSALREKSSWFAQDILKAYTSSMNSLMMEEYRSLLHISECIFHFVTLFSECENVTSDDKLTFFNLTLETVKSLKEIDLHLLTGSDSQDIDNTDLIQYNRSVITSLSKTFAYQDDQFWEFTLCTLVELIQFLAEVNVTKKSSLELQALMACTNKFAYLVSYTFATASVIENQSIDKPQSDTAIHQKTKTEWDEFFCEGVFTSTLPIFITCASETLKSSSPRCWMSVLNHLSSIASLCPSQFLLNHDLPAKLTMTDNSSIPDSLKTLFNHLCPLLNSQLWCVQVSVFKLLGRVMEAVSVYENKDVDGNKDVSQGDTARSPPEALSLVVEGNSVCLDTFLMTEEIESDVHLEVGTQEHSLALGYLLAWSRQLQLFKCASNEVRAEYAQYFKTHDLVSHLCDHLFRLMPSHPSSAMLTFQLGDGADEMSPTVCGSLSISVYRQCLEVLPALVRTWWVDQNRKTSNYVDRYTMQYISNNLCVQHLTSHDMMSASIEDITIRPRPAAREVSAIYEMAEVTVNMTIKLPDNYPLGKVEVSCDKRVGVSQQQWDKWLLQLNIFLQHQNGSIVEGLKLWKGNIDKKFEGIDDCMVCFSVIHGTTFQLPRLTCRTCKKKFHSSCLYKWFNTSQKSSCPLCRNLF